ncbi:hypothetical protein LINPERPRIM_LOCUS19413, partial [Linum perenne]
IYLKETVQTQASITVFFRFRFRYGFLIHVNFVQHQHDSRVFTKTNKNSQQLPAFCYQVPKLGSVLYRITQSKLNNLNCFNNNSVHTLLSRPHIPSYHRLCFTFTRRWESLP